MYGHLRTRGASRRHMPLGMVEVGYLKARLSDRGALATRSVAFLEVRRRAASTGIRGIVVRY